jgi:hypothetical protein
VQLADAVEELYGVLPEEFIATRTELQRRARADGDRALAAEIGGLGKPSNAAWLSNQLVRHQPDEIGGLLELGDLLREAQENLAGDQLRQLDVQRRRLIAALARQARALAAELGHPVTATVATQVEETLRAAMADPEAREALRAGQLTAPLSYSGLGTAPRPALRVVPPPAPAPAPKRPGREEAARRAEEAARRAEEERRRRELAEAQEAADRATAEAEAAAAAEEDARSDVAELRDREQTVAGRVDELTSELTRLRAERDQVGTDLTEARRRRQAAARHTAEATAARERALTRLAALEEEDTGPLP